MHASTFFAGTARIRFCVTATGGRAAGLLRRCGGGFPRRLAHMAAVLALAATAAAAARAESVLDRIAEDGVLRAGTRANATPFAYEAMPGVFEGFSVDLLGEIRATAERALGRSVRLDIAAVTPADRLLRVAAGELDIVCGITTPTWEREQLVDFSLPFFRDGTRVMVYREHASRIADIAGLDIGVVKGTTTEKVVRDQLPTVDVRLFPDMGTALRAMAAGEVHGVANVGVVLLGQAERIGLPRSVVLLPRTRFLAAEKLACVLPQNDSRWRDLVNRTLVDMFAEVDAFNGRYEEIYDRWFGRSGPLFYPLDRGTRDYLNNVSIWVR